MTTTHTDVKSYVEDAIQVDESFESNLLWIAHIVPIGYMKKLIDIKNYFTSVIQYR